MSRESTQSILKRLDPSWGNLQTDSDDSKYHESCQNDGRTRGRGKGDFSIVLGGRTKSPSNFIVTTAIKPSHFTPASENALAKFPHRGIVIATISLEVNLF